MNHLTMIENTLKNYCETLPNSALKSAIQHALLHGGKRLRPRLFLTALEDYGYSIEPYMKLAASIEMIHTYSLIHDDLPAMDDDDLRRGKPTVHKVFGEATAILAGDALLTDAFRLIGETDALNDQAKVAIIKVFSHAAGALGMVYGQWLDFDSEGKHITYDTLEKIHCNKTARLIEAPLVAAAHIVNPKDAVHWQTIGEKLGLVFQVQDDILEATSSETSMGKSLSDTRHKKSTVVTLLGLDKAKNLANELFETVRRTLACIDGSHEVLMQLIKTIENRKQ